MKYIFTLAWALVCIAVLVFGHSYWKERTAVDAVSEKPAANTAAHKIKNDNQTNVTDIMVKTKNWPQAARDQFQRALEQNKPYKILFVGSKALGANDQGMLKDVVQQLTAAFSSHIGISVRTYDTTSDQFLANKDELEIAAEKAQLIVFEPFLLNDNGNVAIAKSLSNLTTIMEAVKSADPEAVFILQPSFPLYNATFYPIQTARLKQYAAQHKIAYLDHWTAWPASNNPELKNDLLPDQTAPNDKGDQVWSQYLINYLISK